MFENPTLDVPGSSQGCSGCLPAAGRDPHRKVRRVLPTSDHDSAANGPPGREAARKPSW